jgi:hypothetical protein
MRRLVHPRMPLDQENKFVYSVADWGVLKIQSKRHNVSDCFEV